MSALIWTGAIASIPLLVAVHLAVSPYTKVEESFNIQAVHDILTFGVPTRNVTETFKAQYDHMTFPGAVPRTFIGALSLAGLSQPVLWWNDTVDRQALVRGVLGLFNAVSIIAFASNVKQAFGRTAAIWYLLFQASQFHVTYYASRPLPNMFAFGLSTFALGILLSQQVSAFQPIKRTHRALFLLTIAGIIFRSELALLLGCYITALLLQGKVTIGRDLILTGLTGVLVGLGLTVPIDTYFWRSPTPLWPELAAFLSNIFPSEGSEGASAWGTSPWHWYFTSALPRLLMNPLGPILTLTSFLLPSTRHQSLSLILPPLLYTILYSLLPHKETRFILYVVPIFTLLPALSTSYIFNHRDKSIFFRLLTLLILLSTLLTATLSHILLLPLSALNYPGAHALHLLHDHLTYPPPPNSSTNVHLDNLALQTGITRFLQLPPTPGHTYIYDKADYDPAELLTPRFWSGFDYVVTEDPGRCIGSWDVVGSVRALDGFKLVRIGEDVDVEGRGGGRSRSTEAVADMYGEAVAGWWDTLVEDGGRGWLSLRGVWERTLGRRWPRWPVLEVRERLWVLRKGKGVEL